MSLKVECAWARVFIRETKHICTITRNQGEGQAKYGARVLAERYRLYSEHFKGHQNFSTTQKEFNRVVKIIDGKFGNWRNKKEKELYLNRFSPSNWDEERVITKDGKKKHSLTACQTCRLFNSRYQCTFPASKFNRKCNRGPLHELNTSISSMKKPQVPRITKKQLKEVGQDLYSKINETCKENYNSTLSHILTLVPEAGLELKKSPEDKKKIVRDQKRKSKQEIENKIQENDAKAHLSLRQSYSARNEHRFAHYFETKEEARERLRTTPPNVKERSHAPSIENIEGNLTQLLNDAKSWNDQEINWAKKAEEYGIKRKGSQEELKNKGQVLKTYLQANGIDTRKIKTANRKNVAEEEFEGTNIPIIPINILATTTIYWK